MRHDIATICCAGALRHERGLGSHHEKAPHCPPCGLPHAPTGLVSPVIADLGCIMPVKCLFGCGRGHACIGQGLWSVGTERPFCPRRRHGRQAASGSKHTYPGPRQPHGPTRCVFICALMMDSPNFCRIGVLVGNATLPPQPCPNGLFGSARYRDLP